MFPRSFNNETWFMRLPTGEVTLTKDGDLERAFRCGLVDARTPLLGAAAHIWTTLGEAAELPEHLWTAEPAAADLQSGAPWHVRDEDEEAMPSFGRKHRSFFGAAAAAIAVALVLSTVGLGVAHAEGSEALIAATATDGLQTKAMDPLLVRAMRNARQAQELPYHSQRDLQRLTKEQQRRLREIDLARRMRGDDKRDAQRIAAGKPIVVPFASPAFDPFASNAFAE
jgi:negative regulator of sigma E activity